MAKLRVGIIGLGIGEKHIPVFKIHSYCEVVSVCDFSEKKLSYVSGRFPGVVITKNADDILSDPTIDLVSVASYDNFHYEQVVKAIRNGKHVFVEKPLCLYPREAIEIRRALAYNRQVQLSSNLNLRTCPRFKRLRKLVLSGDMGKIFYLEGDYLWGRLQKLTNGWRKEMDFYSIVHGAAVHMVDLLMWLTKMRPVEVQGYGCSIATATSKFRYNDLAVILLKFRNKMVAKVSANGGCVHPHFHRVAVFGTKKTFIHDIAGAKLLESNHYNAEPVEIQDEYPAVEEKGKVISSFIESILDPKAKALVTTEDVFATMSVCFAAEKAIEKGEFVPIEYY